MLLCLVYKLNTAQMYFNNRYDNFNNGDITTGINLFNGDYLIYGCAANSFSFYSLNLGIVDYTGTRIKNRTYNWGSNLIVPNINKCIINSSSYFTIGGTNFYKPDTSLVFLWKLNKSLDSLEYHEFGFVNRTNQLNGIVKDSDKYIYMTGWVDSLYKNSDILLIKTDTSGNEIWKKKIGLPNYDETAWCIKISSDNKLLICGNRRLHNNQATNGAFVLKADTNGAIIWEKYFPSNYGLAATGMVELPNGDIVAIAGKGYGSTVSRYELIKLDASGNVVFDKTYGPMADRAEAYSLIQNQEGNLVAAGQMYYSANNSVNGLMYVFNQNGDSIFSREYAVQPGSQNYFRDLVQAPDKGYVFSGFISPIFANGGTGNQDIWLLKTDSTFCEGAFNCGYPTAITEAEALEAGEMSVYPNPAKDVLYIDFVNNYEKRKIEIYDSFGKLVLNEDVSTQNSSLNIHHLQSGVYFYRIEDSEKVLQTNKLIIIK